MKFYHLSRKMFQFNLKLTFVFLALSRQLLISLRSQRPSSLARVWFTLFRGNVKSRLSRVVLRFRLFFRLFFSRFTSECTQTRRRRLARAPRHRNIYGRLYFYENHSPECWTVSCFQIHARFSNYESFFFFLFNRLLVLDRTFRRLYLFVN